MKKCLIIQTAFLGDVILATSIIEKLNSFYPNIKIDFLLRKGNESLFRNHPYINNLIVWQKQKNKYKNLFKLIKQVRTNKYDLVINVQRYASSGLIAGFSGGDRIIGFKKNPISFLFHTKVAHKIGNNVHEVIRNHDLIKSLTDDRISKPKLYPSEENFNEIVKFNQDPYLCFAPASVWQTKQLPIEKWVELIKEQITKGFTCYLIGGPNDNKINENIITRLDNAKQVINLAGKLSLLESAALISAAQMSFVNDSGPLHIASSMNAPVTAFFCSTLPEFGFGPLSDNSTIVQVDKEIPCRPCGLHGKIKCPEGHFKCGYEIKVKGL